MSDIRFEGWLHRSGTGGVYQDSAGNVGIASTQPKTRLDIGNGGFQVGPTGIATVTTVNTTNLINATPLTNRNLIINGAMRIAQRGTSSTTNGYGDLDRWKHEYASTDEAPTYAQVALTTSDTPYTLGLTKTAKITNGNQTSDLQAGSLINFNQQIEAQNIRNSGWDYTSSSSYITLSFWVRASVAQNYHGFVKTADGTNYIYPYETGTLSANTWTKITKSIPGNSNLQIDDNTDSGFQIFPIFFGGTSYTSSDVVNNAWATWSSGARSKDQTATWYETNDSTLEITGVQLEVGSVATPFEHRPVSDELARCQRYFYNVVDYNDGSHNDADNNPIPLASYHTTSSLYCHFTFPVAMRAVPTFVETAGITQHYRAYRGGGTDQFDSFNGGIWVASTKAAIMEATSGIDGTAGYVAFIKTANSGVKYTAFSAEI